MAQIFKLDPIAKVQFWMFATSAPRPLQKYQNSFEVNTCPFLFLE